METQLAPTLQPGDVVILDNLSSHKSKKAKAFLKKQGAWVLFLPPYSPDLNPIEMAFSKLKAHLRRLKARTISELWDAVDSICDLYTRRMLELFQTCRLCCLLKARRSSSMLYTYILFCFY